MIRLLACPFSPRKSMSWPARIACTISGDKGSGLLLIEQGPSGLQNADWAILEIDGNSYVVFGSPPEDLGAAVVPDTEADEETTDDGGTDEASGS